MDVNIENISFAEVIREDILTCAVCLEMLSDPRTLPCLHTYCKSCLLSMVESKNKKRDRYIRCPECRNETRLFREGVSQFKTSFFIHSLMEVYDTKRQAVMCTVCQTRNRHRKAVSKCTTCLDGLCEQCGSGHLQSTMTLHHKVVPLREFASGMYDSCIRESQKFVCGMHDRDMEFYCDTCETVACMTCIILDHNDHTYDAIPAAYDSRKEELKSMFSQVMSKVEDISLAKSRIEQLVTSTVAKADEAMKAISEAGQAVIAAAEKEVAETEQNAEKLIKPRLTRLSKLDADLEEKLKEWRMSIEFCRKILNDGKPVEVLQIVSLVKQRLAQLAQTDDMTIIPEIEFNTRIIDVHVNESFRENISLGIFQPEQKLSRGVKVADCSCQTEESMYAFPNGSASNLSQATDCHPELDLCDSGTESQLDSLSMGDDVQSRQNTKPSTNVKQSINTQQPARGNSCEFKVDNSDVDFWSDLGCQELTPFVIKTMAWLLICLFLLYLEKKYSCCLKLTFRRFYESGQRGLQDYYGKITFRS